MKETRPLEIVFLLIVIATSLVGFSSLLLDEEPALTAYHILHIITSLAWLLLSVHSASKNAVDGLPDELLVQSVVTTLEVALLVFLGFLVRRNRDLHASCMMSTSVPFFGIALFFTFISYVPRFRIEGPETFSRFAEAGQTISLFLIVTGLLFFLRNWRTAWPWILASSFFTLNGLLQVFLDSTDRTTRLTALVMDRASTSFRFEPGRLCGLASGGVGSRSGETGEAASVDGSRQRVTEQTRATGRTSLGRHGRAVDRRATIPEPRRCPHHASHRLRTS